MDDTTAAGGPQDDVVGPSDDAKGPRDRVSLTAFGFSLVGFSLVAIPLGVWGLVRTRSGAGRGRGFAVAALGVSAAWIVATFALFATSGLLSNIDTIAAADLPENGPAPVVSGASATPGATSAATGTPEASQPTKPLSKPRKIHWEDLKAGMCLTTAPESASDIPVVDCRAAHADEVITRTVLTGPSKWPGDDVIDASADTKCRAAFATYVGVGYDDSRLELDFWTNDRDGWNDGARTLVCLVYDPSTPTLTGAFKGTAQ